MYFQSIVNYLKSQGNKESAKILNDVFFKLLIDFSPCSIFVEAGAFEGTASILMKKSVPNIKVYAFEANIDNFNHFKDSLSEVEYHYSAISNYTGITVFKQQSHNTSTGMVFPKVRGNNSLRTRTLDKETVYNYIEVPCITFDDFFEGKINKGDTIGMWLDLEGTAYEALSASTSILHNISFLKVEVEDKQYWENQKLSEDVIDLLSNYHLIPIFRDFEGVTVNQYNILFCNKNLVTPELEAFLNNCIYGK
jgi:FkbM family methyltransferase